MNPAPRLCAFLCLALVSSAIGETPAPETRFLNPGQLVFSADFKAGEKPDKPAWFLRKTDWSVEGGVLVGAASAENNLAPFIRLMSKTNGGPLPQDYILKFSFKTEPNPRIEVNKSNKNQYHAMQSAGNRFSIGHYAAGFAWTIPSGMTMNILHGTALSDPEFHIEKGRWHHVTIELRGNEVLAWFQGGPAYFMQHDSIAARDSGFEFFVPAAEIGHLANLKVWSLGKGERPGWEAGKRGLLKANRAFIGKDHPGFSTEKEKVAK